MATRTRGGNPNPGPSAGPAGGGGSRSGNYQPNDGDVQNSAELARLVRELFSSKYALEARVKQLEDEVTELTQERASNVLSDAQLSRIRDALQANGRFPLDITGLTITTTPPVGRAVVVSTTLTSENQYGVNAIGFRLIGTSARIKDEIWYVKEGNPKTWTKLVL